jgi:hypothetical protein
MKFSILALVFVAQSAFAHFEIGVYRGDLVSGGACAFEIKTVHFKNNVRHPLNEVVGIDLEFLGLTTQEFTHLPIVDVDKGTVRPKREILSVVRPFAGGAEAIEMFMDDQGPARMVKVTEHYQNPDANSKVECHNLKLQQ